MPDATPPSAARPSAAGSAWPLRTMMAMIIASIAAVAGGTWQVAEALAKLQHLTEQQQRLDNAGASALYHHELMTSTAYMLALEGSALWQKRYEAAQQQMGQDLIDLRLMTPERLSPLNAVVEEAGSRASKVETESFRVVRSGNQAGGLAVLGGTAYREAKEHFMASLNGLYQNLGDRNRAEEARLRKGLALRGGILTGVLAMLAVIWLVCLRLMLKWQKHVQAAVAQQQEVERQLKEQGRMLDNIIGHLPVGVFVKSVPNDYRWDIWNHKAEELFEMRATDVLGTSDFQHFPRHQAEFFRKTDEQVMREHRVIDVEVEEVTSPRGTWLAHTIKVPIYDEAGKPYQLLGIIEDITVKKQRADRQLQDHATELEAKNAQLEAARRQTEEADRAKAAFLANMDSELRPSITAIAAAADTLLRTELSAVQSGEVRSIRQCAGLVLHTLNDMAELSDSVNEAIVMNGAPGRNRTGI